MKKPFAVLLAALSLVLVSQAQSPDAHFASPRLSAISHRSAFVHGYLHGYEEGFHQGDVRLYMGAESSPPPAKSEPKGYRKEFGDKHLFQAGYGSGLLSGYSDAISGRSFRATDVLLQFMGLPALANSPGPRFDEGFALGYMDGKKRGLSDGRKNAPFAIAEVQCGSGPNPNLQGFCLGFERGYRMGYTDGYRNQRELPQEATARK